MQQPLPLSGDKKLNVTYRVEAGCLGPDGHTLIEDFCRFAQERLLSLDADFVHWIIEPRSDFRLSETAYAVKNKNMTHDQAARYLMLFGKSLDEFETHLHNSFSTLIEEYLKRT